MTRGGWDEAFVSPGLLRRPAAVDACDVVKNTLHKDDSHINAAGNVRQELVEEIVGGVESVAGKDASNGRGAIRVNARNVKVGDLGTDGIIQQRGIVRH